MPYLDIFALIGLVFSNTAQSDQSTSGVVERAKDGTHEGAKAAKILGGHKHIIECLKNSPNFG